MATTIDDVKKIIDTSISDSSITAFIASASALVNATLSGSTNLSADLLTQIETWLTAHFIACTMERVTKEEGTTGAVGAYVKYAGEYGKNLESTPYGQTVLLLDVTGRFADLGKRGVSINAIRSFD